MRSPAATAGYFATLGVVVGLAWWMARALLVPIVEGEGVEYVLATPSLLELVAAAIVAAAGVLAIHLAIGRWSSGDTAMRVAIPLDHRFPFSTVVLTALLALPYLNMIDSLAGRLPALTYFFADLRHPWLAAIIVLVAVDQLSIHGDEARTRPARRLPVSPASAGRTGWTGWMGRTGWLVFGAAMLFALLSSPVDRFHSKAIGDEPKYLRYAENIYQGRGFATTDLQDIADLPVDYRFTPWWIPGAVLGAMVEEVANLAADARMVLTDGFPETFHRAEHAGDLFFWGKSGDLYQFHTPGLSMLMFPAYWVDRALLNDDNLFHHQFPSYLWATSLLLATLYAAWALVAFRLFVNYGETSGRAGLLVAATFFTVPVLTFNYQYYPEVAGGLLTFAVANWLLFAPPESEAATGGGDTAPRRRLSGAALFFGALAGFLPWLNIRYALMATVLLSWAIYLKRRERRTLVGFVAGWGLVVALFGLFTYRTTGSFSPTAVWSMHPNVAPFSLAKLAGGFLGFPLQARQGIVPYSPIFLLCLPGIVVMLRRRRRVFAFWMSVAFALAIPAAGHSWNGAVSTPGRMIVAVVPFAGLALAEACRRWGHRRLFWGAFATLLVVSMHNAYAFSAGQPRLDIGFSAANLSGWTTMLLFPIGIDRQGWSFNSADDLLGPLWLAIAAALLGLGWWSERGARHDRRDPAASLVAGSLAVVVIATILTAALPTPYSADHIVGPRTARSGVVRFLAAHDCAVCVSSRQGRLDPQEVAIRWGSQSFRFVSAAPSGLAFGAIDTDPAAPGRQVIHLSSTPGGRRLLVERAFSAQAFRAGTLSISGRTRAFGALPVLDVEIVDIASGRILATAAATADDFFASDYRELVIPFRGATLDGGIAVRIFYGGGADLWLLSTRLSPTVGG